MSVGHFLSASWSALQLRFYSKKAANNVVITTDNVIIVCIPSFMENKTNVSLHLRIIVIATNYFESNFCFTLLNEALILNSYLAIGFLHPPTAPGTSPNKIETSNIIIVSSTIIFHFNKAVKT